MISYIQRKASNFTRQELLDLLDEVQKIVYSSNTATTRVAFNNNGMPPFLATIDGIYVYTCPDNCRRTKSIFAQTLTSYASIGYNSRYKEYIFRDRAYYEIPIRSTDATETANAMVTFGDNPGTTASTYYHLYYVRAINLISENVQLSLPVENHIELAHGVIALARMEKFGNSNEWEYWKNNTLNRIRYNLNQGAQGNISGTLTQREYRNYDRSNYN